MCLVNIREQNNYAEACKYGSKLGKHAEKKYPLCLCPWVKIIECPISFIKIPFESLNQTIEEQNIMCQKIYLLPFEARKIHLSAF